MHDPAAAVLAGDSRALARALTLVENDPERGATLLEGLRAKVGRAHRVGVTGPPGAGKSTLVSALITGWRRAGRRVGVLAVDPSSAFTGGALLGDRIRMTQHLGDGGVFVRSLASRGAPGGLAVAAEDLADVLDAAGFDPVVIETVGVGQGEMDVVLAVDTTVLVLAPGGGDDIQALKAGLIEMADIVVVNQADRAGADRMQAALTAAFELRAQGAGGGVGTGQGGLPPGPPVCLTVATTGQGVEAVRAAIDARGSGTQAGSLVARRLARAERRLRAEVERRRAAEFWQGRTELLGGLAGDLVAGRILLSEAVARLLSGGAR